MQPGQPQNQFKNVKVKISPPCSEHPPCSPRSQYKTNRRESRPHTTVWAAGPRDCAFLQNYWEWKQLMRGVGYVMAKDIVEKRISHSLNQEQWECQLHKRTLGIPLAQLDTNTGRNNICGRTNSTLSFWNISWDNWKKRELPPSEPKEWSDSSMHPFPLQAGVTEWRQSEMEKTQ